MEAGRPDLHAVLVLGLGLRQQRHVGWRGVGARHEATERHDVARQTTLKEGREGGGRALDGLLVRVEELGGANVVVILEE